MKPRDKSNTKASKQGSIKVSKSSVAHSKEQNSTEGVKVASSVRVAGEQNSKSKNATKASDQHRVANALDLEPSQRQIDTRLIQPLTTKA